MLPATGSVLGRTPASPEAETSARFTDLESPLAELDVLWQRVRVDDATDRSKRL